MLRSFIVYQELEYLDISPDTAIDIWYDWNSTVLSNDPHPDIKNFYNERSDFAIMRPRNFLEETFLHKFMGVAGCVCVLHGQANDQIIPGGEGGVEGGREFNKCIY